MSRCSVRHRYGGDQCKLEEGHEGPHESPPDFEEPTAERREELQALMNEDMDALRMRWRAAGVPWTGIGGFLLAEVAGSYSMAGVAIERIPVTIAKVLDVGMDEPEPRAEASP